MELVKPAIDVGLYTGSDDLEASLAFWQDEVGLPYEELLKVGGGVHQHRLTLDGAGGVLKVNASRAPLAEAASGLTALAVRGRGRPRRLRSPEGVDVAVVESGPTTVTVSVRDLAATRRWWTEGLGAVEVAQGDDRLQLGETVLVLQEHPERAPTVEMAARGLRYLTVQIRDVRAEHARLVALQSTIGGSEGRPPVQLGEVAFISFVRSPDGDWVELSQRASLTGPLPGK